MNTIDKQYKRERALREMLPSIVQAMVRDLADHMECRTGGIGVISWDYKKFYVQLRRRKKVLR